MSHHMTPNEFRAHGKALVDWIADYYEQIERYPVLSRVAPGEVRAALPAAPPQTAEPFADWMADVERAIMPGITHWQSPNFFAYFPANASFPSILGELLSAGLGVQGMLWQTSPAVTELEMVVLDWLVGMLGLPEHFLSISSGGGVIQDTASSAVLAAMVAARDRVTSDERRATSEDTKYEIRDTEEDDSYLVSRISYLSEDTKYEIRDTAEGDDSYLVSRISYLADGPSSVAGNDPRLRVYCSTQTHSSVEKAAGVCGVGRANLRQIAVDGAYAMRPDALRQAIEDDLAAGLRPFFVVATLGTTSSNAVDPIRAIGDICREFGVWLHVDGAMSGTAALCPEFRPLQDGIELADSYAFNPHKWMFTNFDCDVLWVADRAALIRSLTILPEYLKNAATSAGAVGTGIVHDYRDWHVQLGRRFRALKLWFVIRHYGVEGLQHHVREHVRLAGLFAGWVAADPRFELAAPAPLNLVCFRLRAGDEANRALLARLNDSGRAYLTHTVLDGRYTLRLCVGQTHTEERHVRAVWQQITGDESAH